MSFAAKVFKGAGIYGLVLLPPMYFLEQRMGVEQPPAITHPEYFYGFLGVAIAWQIAFLIIARDPARYRLMMLPSAVEKFSYFAATFALFLQGRAAIPVLVTGSIDGLLGLLFVWSFFATKD